MFQVKTTIQNTTYYYTGKSRSVNKQRLAIVSPVQEDAQIYTYQFLAERAALNLNATTLGQGIFVAFDPQLSEIPPQAEAPVEETQDNELLAEQILAQDMPYTLEDPTDLPETANFIEGAHLFEEGVSRTSSKQRKKNEPQTAEA